MYGFVPERSVLRRFVRFCRLLARATVRSRTKSHRYKSRPPRPFKDGIDVCKTDTDAARSPIAPSAQGWTKILARYRNPSHARSIVEIAITIAPLAALWALAWAAYYFGYWWMSLLLAVPAAGFLVRAFMIQHDCGHGAFFRHRLANDWVGRVIGVLTLTPYDFWRRTHAIHHASSGHLERRGVGDIDTLTVARVSGAVALGPAALSRLPPSRRDVRHRPRLSVHAAAPAAGRPDARQRLDALDQHHGDQSRHRRRSPPR